MSIAATINSFSGGEWMPPLWYKNNLNPQDQAGYDSACRLMRNAFPIQQGSVMNRSGTQYIGTCKNGGNYLARLESFTVSKAQSYLLEFGLKYVRFIANVNGNIGYVTVGTPAAYSATVTYSQGSIASNGGVNYYYFNTSPAMGIPTTNTAYWYPQTSNILEVPTPYLDTDLSLLDSTQSADVMYLAHPSYPPAQLTRLNANSFVYTVTSFVPSITSPNPLTVDSMHGSATVAPTNFICTNNTYPSAGGGGRFQTSWVVTAVVGGVEGVISTVISGVGYGSSFQWTAVASATAYNLYSFEANSNSFNDQQYHLNISTSSTSVVSNISTGGGILAQNASGTYLPYVVTAIAQDGEESLPTNVVAASNGGTLTWTAVANVSSYNIYQAPFGYYGFVANAGPLQTTYVIPSAGVTPDFTKGPPQQVNYFTSTGNYPSINAFHAGRLYFADTNNNPQAIFGTTTANFNSFNQHTPIQDDDGFTFTITSDSQEKVQTIRWLIPQMNGALLGTDSGVFALLSGGGYASGEPITPTSIFVPQQDFTYGACTVKPISVGNNAMYPDYSQRRFRDITYSIYVYGYSGNEVGIKAQHLFDSNYGNGTCIRMAYQAYPYSIAWIVRSDGGLVGFSYQKEAQNINLQAWHHHDTPGGFFEDVCAIPNTDGSTDVYFIVRRTISGVTTRYIERLAPRVVTSISTCWFLDCALQYNGTASNYITGNTQLIGQQVYIVANGRCYTQTTAGTPIIVDSSGGVTIPDGSTATVALIGLFYQPEVMPMAFDCPTQSGTSMNKTRQIREIYVSLINTAALQVGSNASSHLNSVPIASAGTLSIFTGEPEPIPMPSGNLRDCTVYFTSNLPLPFEISRVVANIDVGST